MKDVSGVLRPVKEDGRVWVNQGTLNIKKVVHSDGGKYQCIVRNSIGERRIESALIVTGMVDITDKMYRDTLKDTFIYKTISFGFISKQFYAFFILYFYQYYFPVGNNFVCVKI